MYGSGAALPSDAPLSHNVHTTSTVARPQGTQPWKSAEIASRGQDCPARSLVITASSSVGGKRPRAPAQTEPAAVNCPTCQASSQPATAGPATMLQRRATPRPTDPAAMLSCHQSANQRAARQIGHASQPPELEGCNCRSDHPQAATSITGRISSAGMRRVGQASGRTSDRADQSRDRRTGPAPLPDATPAEHEHVYFMLAGIQPPTQSPRQQQVRRHLSE